MELIFENAKKGGAESGAGGPGLTGAGRRRGAGGPGSTGAGIAGAGGPGLTGAGKKLNGRALGRIARQHTKLYGAGWFGDFVDGFKDAFTGVMNVALPIADLIPGVGAITTPLKIVNRALGGGSKPKRVRGGNEDAKKEGEEAFQELLKNNSKQAPVGGSKRGLKTRIELVKEVMKKKGLSLTAASSYVKTHELKYKK